MTWSKAGFLLCTLLHNWHHDKYKIRGGKKQIRDPCKQLSMQLWGSWITSNHVNMFFYRYPIVILVPQLSQDWANGESHRLRSMLARLHQLCRKAAGSRPGDEGKPLTVRMRLNFFWSVDRNQKIHVLKTLYIRFCEKAWNKLESERVSSIMYTYLVFVWWDHGYVQVDDTDLETDDQAGNFVTPTLVSIVAHGRATSWRYSPLLLSWMTSPSWTLSRLVYYFHLMFQL